MVLFCKLDEKNLRESAKSADKKSLSFFVPSCLSGYGSFVILAEAGIYICVHLRASAV